LSPERWQRVKDVLGTCLGLAASERAAYLDSACGDDAEVRAEVESLMASYDEADDVLERPLHPADDRDLLAGRTAGEYRLVREIGEGGMSRVYLAERTGPGEPRQAAIKVIKRGMDYEFVLRRFRHERRIMGALDHPNIAKLIGGGSTEEGIPYFVIEHIPGLAIDRYCDEKRLTVRARLELFLTVCAAVSYAHERGVVHRDIKPGNILITPEGVPKLLDFGIAKVVDPSHWTLSFDMTASVLRLMTPEYASPEQVKGEYIFEPTDIYSLGVLLYEMLTGHHPYQKRSGAAHELARAICEEEPARPSSMAMHREEVSRLASGAPVLVTPEEVSEFRHTQPGELRKSLAGDLDNIVLMALRKEPRRRYASVREMAEDIRRHLDGRPTTARKDGVPYRTGKMIGRHRKGMMAAVAIPALVLLGIGAWRWAGLREGVAEEGAPRVRPLTTLPGNERQPAFSPDGRSVAFVWGGEDGKNADIYVRPLDGALRRVTQDKAEDASPAWSPDGSRIAYLRTKHNQTEVILAAQASGAQVSVADVFPNRIEATGRHLDWLPDGSQLAVVDKAPAEAPFSIYLVGVADGRKTKLTKPPPGSIGDSSPAISPDGKWVSFLRSPSSGVSEVWAMPLDRGGEERRLTFDDREVLSQTWTPDGGGIVFASNRGGGYALWRIAARGGTARRVPGAGEGVSEPAFSRDGRRLVFSQFFRDANIWRAEVGGEPGAAPRKLISSSGYDSSAQYSADGRRIAFRSDRSGFHEIWVCDGEGRNARQVTHFNGPLTGSPRWSADGKWIAFDSRPEGQADVYVVAAEGGAPRRLTSDASEDVAPSWSRDGRWVYFASNRTGSWQVWKMATGGGKKTQVTRNGGFAAFESEDGKYLYYALSRSHEGLYRMPVGGGAEEAVVAGLKAGYWGYWALSPRGVYVMDSEGESALAGVHLLRFDGVRSRVFGLEKNIVPGDAGMAVSPDGRWLLYTQLDQSGSDLMLVDWQGSP
jgi:Tol biopolymer transport system component/serine/threonine protein kinase